MVVRTSFASRRATALLFALVLGVSSIALSAPRAFADTSPPSGTPETVSADALPTVQINGVVWRTAIVGNTVYAAGSFTKARPAGTAAGSASEVSRSNLLAFNLATGALLPFAPVLNAQARTVKASPDGSKIYVGGDFTTVSGQVRSKIAAFDTATGALDANFHPSFSSQVRAIAVTSTTVYAGGDFLSVGGVSRTRLAAVSRANGALQSWAPTADDLIEALVVASDGSRVVIGGRFQTINGAPKVGIGAVDGTTGVSTAWTSTPIPATSGTNTSWVTDLYLDNGVVYGSGNGEGGHWFDGRFAADFATGDLIWLDNCYGASYGIYAVGQVVYTVAHSHDCASINGFPQTSPTWTFYRSMALTKYAVGNDQTPPGVNSSYSNQPIPALLHWFPTINTGTYTGQSQGAWAVTGNSQYVVLGGEFTTINGSAQQGLVRFGNKTTSTNKQGPIYYPTLPPTAVSLSPGTVRVAWPATWDRDNATLRYELYRDTGTTPIYSIDQSDNAWTAAYPTVPTAPSMGFVDHAVVPGSTHSYRLKVIDPFGNNLDNMRSANVVVSSAAPSAYAQDVLAGGATAYWRLGESGTTAYDWAGFNDASKSTGVANGAAGAVIGDANPASTFDGTVNGLAVSNSTMPATPALSVEAWVKTTSTSGGKIVGYGNANSGTSGNYDRHLYMDNAGRVFFGLYPGGVRVLNSGPGFNDGAWHHIVGTMDPTAGMNLFVDAKRVGHDGGTTSAQSYAGYWRIGGDNLGGWPNQPASNFLSGSIDDVAIYATALSSSAVITHFVDSGRVSPIPPAPSDAYGQAVYGDAPDLYWRLGESSGGAALDASPNGNDGSYTGGVTLGQAGAVTGTSNTSVGFDGANGGTYSNGSVNNPQNYSEEAWFKTTTGSGGKIIGFGAAQTGGSDGYDRHVYMQDNGQLVFGVWTGFTNTITTPLAYNNGAWHHVVATQSTTSGMKLYVDGKLIGSNPQTGAQDYSGYWRVGGDNTWGSSSAYFNGTIDEVAVYSTVLNATRVAAHYTAGGGVLPVNANPTSTFTASCPKLTCTLDGTTSSDTDGAVTNWAWNFGDGNTGTGATISHTYSAAGPYTVTLTVTDNDGGTGQSSQGVVTTAPPAPPTDAYGQAVYGDSPSLYWRLGESSGTTAVDSGQQGNDGSYVAGVGLGSAGAVVGTSDTAASFDGVDDGVSANSTTSNPTTYSEELWFKTTTTSGGKLIGFGDQPAGLSGNYDRHVYMQDNGQLVFGTWTGSPNTITSPSAYNDGSWHHVVASQSSGGMNLFVDGASVGTNPQTQAQPFTGYWKVGGDPTWGSSSSYFNGNIDEVAVYPTALSPARVAAHYAAGTGPSNVAPVASFTKACTNLVCGFDGSGSSDPDGSVSSYAWTFGDAATGTGVSPSHTYAAAGTYLVSLTVIDNQGAPNTSSQSVVVTAPPNQPYATDAFGRTLATGWGSADTGGAWTPIGTAANFSTSAGAGNLKMAAAGSGPSIYLNGVSASDTDLQVTVTTDKAPTGGGIYVSAVGRRVSGVGDYRAKIRLMSTGAVSVTIVRLSSTNVETVIVPASTVSGLTYAAGTNVRIRFQATGASPTTLRAKVWLASGVEPLSWQISGTDSTVGYQTVGSVGLMSYLSSTGTNAPVVARFDDFLAGPTV